MNTQSEPMNMLFYGHFTQGEDGTPALVGFDFASRHNRDPSEDGSQDSDTSDDDDQLESDSDAVSDAGFSSHLGKQAFTHLGNLDTRALKPSRIGRETDRKKASLLPGMTAVSSSSKRNLAAMPELDESNSPADPAEP